MIQITLTEEQAHLVGKACEFYARIRMGQFGEIAFHCAEKHCPKDPQETERAWLELRKHIYPDLCGIGHSYGIGKFEDADKAFDVYQAIRHTMHGIQPFSYYELPKCVRAVQRWMVIGMVDCKECVHYLVCKQYKNKPYFCNQYMDYKNTVEVVRCKDCKHYDKDALWCNKNSYAFGEEYHNWYSEDYCSYGERKDNEV